MSEKHAIRVDFTLALELVRMPQSNTAMTIVVQRAVVPVASCTL